MPGNSQGIVVSIQAKIEGWQNQIKAIQDALKNIKAGTGISKDLTKDLKQVESLVNNLGKNINQRLTSDSQITGFTDKLREVDEIFAHMGQRMTSISFADMDPSYITNNFKDLLTAIEQANDALSSGMTNSFQNAIAESTNLQKAFNKLGIDPSKMGAEELKKLLETKSSGLTEEIAKTNKEIDNLRANAKAAKDTMEEMQKSKIMQVTDTKATAKTIVGDTSGLGTRQMNTAALQDLETKINDVILKGGTTLEQKLKDKREQVDKAIKELVNVQTVEEARKKLQEIQDLFASVKAKGDFTKDIKIDKITDEQLTQWIPDPAAVQNKLTEIKSILAEYKIDPTVLNKINMEELIKQGNFDKLADEIDKALRKTQDVAEKDIQKIKQTFDKFKDLANTKQRQVMSDSATKYNIDQGLDKWDGMIQKIQQENAALREEVEKLKAQLAERAIANVKALGGKTAASGAQGIQDSTNAAKAYEAQLSRVKSAEQALGKLQGVVQRWFSIYAVIRMVNNAIHSMIDTIKELDKTITNIAIVTDMSQDDLWKQMPKYTQMARDYASSIAGVYEVSQLYYQQGLEMAEVMSLTEATLKMARISGLGYADATDYMTNAVRSFKMEMSEATTVVDVYSAVAASSATSVTELATAMSKTASSAEAVGSSFQNTTAMMAVMIEATRESPENIGSALKSIISRYGELKQNMTGTDTEGEEYSLNKVDTALQSIGISIHDVNGEFRDFDDVIMELAGKWDTVDKNTQRYIATVMAGNRQQSRFLALVSSGDRLRELADEAANSEDASQLQFLKSLDSIDSKVQQLQTSIQALYTNSGLEQAYKGVLDFANRILTTLDNISNNQGLIGIGAKIAASFTPLAILVTQLFTSIKLKFATMQAEITAKAELASAQQLENQALTAYNSVNIEEERLEKIKQLREQYDAIHNQRLAKQTQLESLQAQKSIAIRSKFGMGLTAGGLALTTVAASMDVNQNRELKAGLTGIGGILSGVGTGMMVGGIPGAIMGAVTALPSIIEAIGMATESTAEKITKLKNNIDTSQNELIKSKDDLKTLTQYKNKYEELYKARNESNEAYQDYINLSNEIAEKYPELISGMDEEGNYLVSLTDKYDALLAAKQAVYNSSFINAGKEQIAAYSSRDYLNSLFGLKDVGNNISGNGIIDLIKEGLDNTSLLGRFSNSLNNMTSDQWSEGLSSVLTTAWEEAITNGLNEVSQYKSIFGEDLVTSKAFNQVLLGNNLGATKNYLESRGINDISTEEHDLIFYILQDVAEKLDENIPLEEINKYFNQWFDGFKLNEEVFRGLGRSSAVSEQVEGYRDNLIKSLNLQATKNSIEQQNLELDTIQSQWMSDYIQSVWENSSQYKTALQTGDFDTAWTGFMAEIDQRIEDALSVDEYQNLYDGLSRSQKKQLNEIYNNAEQYTNMMLDTINTEWDDVISLDLYNLLNDRITEANEKAIQSFEESMDELVKEAEDQGLDTTFISGYNSWISQFGSSVLKNITANFTNILDNDNLSISQKASGFEILSNIYDSIGEISDLDTRQLLINKVNAADLSSLTDIFNLIDDITNLKLDIDTKDITDNLDKLSQIVTVNLNTEISNLLDNYSKQVEEFNKQLSSYSKGLDFKAAVALAEQLGITLDEFTQQGNTFYLKDINLLKEHYIKENEEYQKALEDRIQQKKELYASILELPDTQIETEYFDLEDYLLSEDEEYRKLIYEYWEDEIKNISPTWTFENLEKYRANRSEYNRLNWIDENQFKNLSKESSIESGIKEFNINEIISRNNYNFKAIENELINEWSAELEDTNIDIDALLTDLKAYIDNEDFSQTFADYTTNESYKLLDSVTKAEQEAVQYLMASTQLSAGDIEGFLKTAGVYKTAGDFYMGGNTLSQAQEEADLYNQTLTNAIASGDISNLPEELQQYAKLIYDSYNKISSNIFNSAITALEKGTDAAIEVNALNADKLIESGLVQRSDIYDEEGNLTTSMVIIPYEQIKNMTDAEFDNFLNVTATSYEDRVKAIGIRMSKDKPDIKSSSEKVNDDLKKISYDEITSMWHDMGLLDKDNVSQEHINQLMKEWGLQYDAYGNIIGDATLIDKEIENLLQQYTSGKISREEWVKQKYKLEQLKEDIVSESDQTKGKALSDVIDNYTSVSSEQFSDLMGAFADLTLEQRTALESTFTLNSDRTRTFDITKFKQLVANGIIPLSLGVNHIIEESLEKQIDDARSALTNATKLVTSGTTSQVEIQKWIDTVKELDILEGAGVEDVFEYDELLDAWTLKPEILYEYAQKQAEALGLQGEALTKFVEAQTLKPLAAAVDIASFLKSSNWDGQSAINLRTQLENWATQHWHGVRPDETTLDGWIETISTGGQAAVDLAMKIATDAGKELTAEEMQQIYAPLVQKYSGLADQISNLVIGQYIGEGDLRTILESADIVDKSTGLVKQVENMAAAYLAIYDSMQKATGHTTSDLNNIYAKYLTELEQGDIDAVAAMGDAMGMTYDTLGEILGKSGESLETWLEKNKNIYQNIGAGKIRITDFAEFAGQRGWLPGTEEYTKAFKAYNDALIELDHKTEDAIYEELSSIVDAKAGDRVNITQLQTALGLSNEAINTYLGELGGYVEDGILTIVNANDIPAIIAALAEQASKAGLVIPEKMAELQDAINGLLENITSIISKGIKGGLTAKDVQALESWSGLDLDTTRMKDGLKLSQKSAEELYEKLKQIDSISAQIVLDELNESIEESVTNTKRLQGEIAQLRATTESDDFKFMDHDIPSGQNNPLNYFENWTKAFKALEDAGKGRGADKGKMAYQDFYNMITEMGNLAETTGQMIPFGNETVANAEQAAALIEKGARYLSVAADGTLKVDLSKLGVDFVTGAKDMKQNVGKGIQEVAKSQVEMLDSMIQLLETIVAMEDLGDLADEGEGDKNVIEIDDILPEIKFDKNKNVIGEIGDFSQAYKDWRNGILHQIKEINEDGTKNSDFNKDLADAMKAIKIGEFSFEEILGFSPSELASKGKDFMDQYSAVLNSFWKAAQSGDYDLNHLFSSIREVLAGSGFDGEISIGDMKLVGKYNTVLMVDKDGNITTDDGTEFKGTNAFENAARYQKAKDIDVLKQSSMSWNEETQSVDIKNSIVTNVSYDLTKGTYLITFDDGSTATADSEAAASLAISTYASMMGQNINSEISPENKAQHFTIHKAGMMDLIFEVKDGKVSVVEEQTENGQLSYGSGKIKQILDTANDAVEEQAKKLEQESKTNPVTIEGVDVQIQEGKTATLDVTNLTITTTGTPQPIELTPTPEFKLSDGTKVKVNVDNITPKSEGKLNPFTYDQLDATITTINAIYDQVPNKDQVNLHEIKYDTLQAAIKEVQAKFNDKPNIDGITLEEPTYSKMLGILLASIYLTRAEESSIDPTGITIGDNEVEIADIINALLTGQLVLNGTDVPAIAGTITLADGTVVPIDSIKAEIAQIIFGLAEGTSTDPDFKALGLKTEYEAPEAVVTQHIEVNYVYDENDPIGTLNRLRGIDNGIHNKVYSETFGRYIEDNFSLIDMGEESDSFTFNVGGSFNIQDVELPEGWNLDEGSGLLTTTSEYYIPTQLRIEQNEIDNSSLDNLQDKYEQLEEPVTAQVEIEDLTGEEFEQILNNQQAVEENSPIEVEVGEKIETNDVTKEHLHQIHERLVDIESKSDQQIQTAAPDAPGVAAELGEVATAAESIPKNVDISVNISTSGSFPKIPAEFTVGSGARLSTGNVGLANAKGTLMGELGPELVVSNGRYFVAGQNGAEFVNLNDDAIVFNHLQTEQLLTHGMSKQRGRAITNERNAVAFATGSIKGGPAMASAKQALAALKQLRAQWQAIIGMGAKDFAGLGGSGGGGGGGGKEKTAIDKAFVKDLELWYNWLQRIAVLEEKINYEEAKRNKIAASFAPSGEEYYHSQKQTLDLLKEQAAIHQSLVDSQEEYFEKRQAEMNDSHNPFSSLYTFDEYGQLKYNNPNFEDFMKMVGRDSETGQANMTAQQQYKAILDFDQEFAKYMQYDSSGNAIDRSEEGWEEQAVQAFWDKIDADQAEMQSLHDSIEEHKTAVVEAQQQQYEILHEIEDNQIDLENKVLNAIVESRQREIDELQKQRDAYEESSQKMIDGLSRQLEQERNMYNRQESSNELSQLQRQLAILQRSGGSASEIANLQQELSQKQRDIYFETQQAQIDALQEASDNQLEKLDQQIDLMTEQLEYEKAHGMLWGQVEEVLKGSPAEIADFIKANTEAYWGQSLTELTKVMREDIFQAEKYKAMYKEMGLQGLIDFYSEEAHKKQIEEEKKRAKEQQKKEDEARKKKEKEDEQKRMRQQQAQQQAAPSSVESAPDSSLEELSCIINDEGYRWRYEWYNEAGLQRTSEWHYRETMISGSGVKAASGGYVNHGIYELGELGPETVLTAEQTQVLRNNILSNSPNSLISLLKSYNENYHNIGSGVKEAQVINNKRNDNDAIIIEHVEVNMNVSKLANDYDAQRAGEQALDQIMRIARKTQANNRVGR